MDGDVVAKRTVCIFSDYNASEKTLCALYMAEHLLWRWRNVIWVVPNAIQHGNRSYGFSHKWDALVVPLELQVEKIKETFEEDCEICIFFDDSEKLYSLLPKTAKTAVILDPYKWKHEASRVFAQKCTYSLVVSPDITKKIAQPNLLENTLLCPFDHCLQLVPKVRITSGTTATLFYPAYGMSFLERQCLRQVSDIVKTCCPASKSVIGYYDTKAVSEPGMDSKTYDWKLMDYIKRTDWIVDLNPRPLMGLFSAFAGALGIQWSCFDISPNTDSYSAARRHIIPYPKGGLIVSNAEEIAGHLVRQLNATFNDDSDRNKGAGSYLKRLAGFTDTMNTLFKQKKKKRKKKK